MSNEKAQTTVGPQCYLVTVEVDQPRSFSGYQTHEVKPAGHNPIRATPYDSEAKPYDVLLPSPRNTVLSVDLPAFDGYATGGES